MPDYTPTPEQIREGCAEIQAGWSEAQEMRRRGVQCRDDCTLTGVDEREGQVSYRFSSEVEGGGE